MEYLKEIDSTKYVKLLQEGLRISPYEENEKRVISGKIVNVTYEEIDWKKNFGAMRN